MSTRPSGGKAVVEDLAETLQEEILSGIIPTGTWLRQEHLATQYGVSRTPVREALRALQAQGIVEVVPHRGALVCGPTVRDIREGYAVRAELEGFAAGLAAEWARDDQIERLRTAERIFRKAVKEASSTDASDGPPQERPRWSKANDLFHEAILDAAGNARLREMIQTLYRSFPRNVTWSAMSGDSRLLRQNADQHLEVLEAIVAGEPKQARAAMEEHVRRSGELVAMRFEQLLDAVP